MTAFFVVLSLLFSQLALANYVCPSQLALAAMAEMMAAGEPCNGMDATQPGLCHQHASNVSQSVEMVKLASPSPPAIVQMLVVPVVLETARALAMPATATPEARPPPDLVYLRTLRLRV